MMIILLVDIELVFHFVEFVFTLALYTLHIHVHEWSKSFSILLLHCLPISYWIPNISLQTCPTKMQICCIAPNPLRPHWLCHVSLGFAGNGLNSLPSKVSLLDFLCNLIHIKYIWNNFFFFLYSFISEEHWTPHALPLCAEKFFFVCYASLERVCILLLHFAFTLALALLIWMMQLCQSLNDGDL